MSARVATMNSTTTQRAPVDAPTFHVIRNSCEPLAHLLTRAEAIDVARTFADEMRAILEARYPDKRTTLAYDSAADCYRVEVRAKLGAPVWQLETFAIRRY